VRLSYRGGHTCVVYEDVDFAEGVDGGFGEGVGVVPVSGVEGDAEALHAGLFLDFGGDFLAGVGVAACDDDLRACFGECPCHFEAEAAAATSDDGCFVCEVEELVCVFGSFGHVMIPLVFDSVIVQGRVGDCITRRFLFCLCRVV